VTATPGTHPLLARETLVVRQKAKLFELNSEFALLDEQGTRIGSVAQVRQSLVTKALRVFSNLDAVLTVTLEVRDAAGTPVLEMHKPWLRRACEISAPGGTVFGKVTKEIRLGRARFALAGPGGEALGTVRAENWRAKDFSVRDVTDVEVARVAKKWRGLARELLTDADTYVIHLTPGLTDPLRSLVVGACLAIDTIMKQKDEG
jgi:uncharacterized protein YxjI